MAERLIGTTVKEDETPVFHQAANENILVPKLTDQLMRDFGLERGRAELLAKAVIQAKDYADFKNKSGTELGDLKVWDQCQRTIQHFRTEVIPELDTLMGLKGNEFRKKAQEVVERYSIPVGGIVDFLENTNSLTAADIHEQLS